MRRAPLSVWTLPTRIGLLFLSSVFVACMAVPASASDEDRDARRARIDRFIDEATAFLAVDTLEQLRQIGTLVSEKVREDTSEYDPGTSLSYHRLTYADGLEVGALSLPDRGAVWLLAVRISSNKWPLADGVRVGAARDAVISALGPPDACEFVGSGEATERCYYGGRADELRFTMRKGRVEEIYFSFYAD